eukprot:31002-Pelagococcus_subviridis.AAC.1
MFVLGSAYPPVPPACPSPGSAYPPVPPPAPPPPPGALKCSCTVYTFLSGSQCAKKRSAVLSTSTFGTLNAIVSYGSAANITY